MLLEILDRLLTGPAQFVNARIHHQPHSPEVLAGELPESARRVLIDAQLRSERLRIKSPPFPVGAIRVEAPDLRERGLLPRDRSLEQVTGNRLVEYQRFLVVADLLLRQIG